MLSGNQRSLSDFMGTNAKGYRRCQTLAMPLHLFNEPRKPV